jgi:hypothetical protein
MEMPLSANGGRVCDAGRPFFIAKQAAPSCMNHSCHRQTQVFDLFKNRSTSVDWSLLSASARGFVGNLCFQAVRERKSYVFELGRKEHR